MIPSVADRNTFTITIDNSNGLNTQDKKTLTAKYQVSGKTEDGRSITFSVFPPETESNNSNINGSNDDDDPTIISTTSGQIICHRIEDPNFDGDINKDLVMYVARHGVSSIDEWYNDAFGAGAAPPPELIKLLGLVETWACIGPKRQKIKNATTTTENKDEDEEETVVVVHLLKKSCIEQMKEMTSYDKPPFVGGPDWIKNGLVVPPFDLNYYANDLVEIK